MKIRGFLEEIFDFWCMLYNLKFLSQFQNARVHVFYFYARMHAQIFMKIFSIVTDYLMNLSFKFHEDLTFCWGDIWLLVTVYAVEL